MRTPKLGTQADRSTMLPRQTRSMAARGMSHTAPKGQEVGHLPWEPALKSAAEPHCQEHFGHCTVRLMQDDKNVIQLRSGRAVPKVGLCQHWPVAAFLMQCSSSDGAWLPAAHTEASCQDDRCSSCQGCSRC